MRRSSAAVKRNRTTTPALAIAAALLLVSIVTTYAGSSEEESFSQTVESGSTPIRPYGVLRHVDYVRVTGCRGDGYNSALQRAVNFLVFAGDGAPDDELIGPNDHDIGYVRRHSRHFFGPLFGDFQAGANDDYTHCRHPTLDRIGRELGFPESELNNGSDANKTLSVRSESPEPDVTVFEVLSRADYMKSTECLASPKTYHKYHLAFFHGVLGWGELGSRNHEHAGVPAGAWRRAVDQRGNDS